MGAKANKETGLTEQQKKFCREYVFDWNGTRAYNEAYPNVNQNTAAASSSRLLRKDNIQAYIAEMKKKTEELAGISRLKVAEEHKKIAFSSIAHLHDTWITRKQFEELTEAEKDSIQEIVTQVKMERDAEGKLKENEYVKVKLYSKQTSLDALSKMFGYNEPDKIEHSGDGIAPVIINKASNGSQ